MATIKSFTDLQQSKKLAEFLPLESADMCYFPVPVREWKDKEDTSKGTQVVFKDHIFALENLPNSKIGEGDTYAWSLAALLKYLSEIKPQEYTFTLTTSDGKWCLGFMEYGRGYIRDEFNDNPVDACVAMIESLYERKML